MRAARFRSGREERDQQGDKGRRCAYFRATLILGGSMKCLLFVSGSVIAMASTAIAQNRTVKLNGGLEAEVLTAGRSASQTTLSLSIKIANKGSSSAYLLLLGYPLVTDNTGGS